MLHELHNRAVSVPEKAGDVGRRAVTEPDPHDFWRRPEEDAELWKSSSLVTRRNPFAPAYVQIILSRTAAKPRR
jgi:hypothetical protein